MIFSDNNVTTIKFTKQELEDILNALEALQGAIMREYIEIYSSEEDAPVREIIIKSAPPRDDTAVRHQEIEMTSKPIQECEKATTKAPDKEDVLQQVSTLDMDYNEAQSSLPDAAVRHDIPESKSAFMSNPVIQKYFGTPVSEEHNNT